MRVRGERKATALREKRVSRKNIPIAIYITLLSRGKFFDYPLTGNKVV
jgi:hypothetical protein